MTAEESVEMIQKHGLYRLTIEASGVRRHVAIIATSQIELEDTLTREYGDWKLIRDKHAPS